MSGNVAAFTVNALGASPPPTSVYRIHGLDFTRDPTIRLNTVVLSHGRDYLFHVDAEDAAWIYLNVPLAADARISVEVPPRS